MSEGWAGGPETQGIVPETRALLQLLEQENSVLVRHHDIEQAVAVHVPNLELRANAGICVNLVPSPFQTVQFVTNQHPWLAGARVAMQSMCPAAFAGYEIRPPTQFGHHQRVGLRKRVIDL